MVKEPMALGAAEGSKPSEIRRLPHNLSLVFVLWDLIKKGNSLPKAGKGENMTKLIKPLFVAVALLLATLLLAPAVQAQSRPFSSILVRIQNMTKSPMIIEGAQLTQGQWVQGRQPKPGESCPPFGGLFEGYFQTCSMERGQGNGGEVLLKDIGSVAWQLPWNGKPQARVNLNKRGLLYEINGPMRDPDYPYDPYGGQHLYYIFIICQP